MASLQERVEAYLQLGTGAASGANELLQELLNDMDTLKEDVKQAQTASNHYYNLMNQEAQSRRNLEKSMDSARFVLVLLDLDSMPFLDKFVVDGIQGGVEAARELRDAVQVYHQNNPFHRVDDKIVLYISANLHGLSKAYATTGIVRDPQRYHDFVIGLTQSHPLTTFVDAGRQKEAVDYKLRAQFNLYYNNAHCQHIIFGGSDGGHASYLDSYAQARGVNDRITVLLSAHTPYSLRNAAYQFLTTTFDVFRASKINAKATGPNLGTPGNSIYNKAIGSSPAYGDRDTSPTIAEVVEANNANPATPKKSRGIKRSSSDEGTPFRRPAPPRYNGPGYVERASGLSDRRSPSPLATRQHDSDNSNEYRPEDPTLVDDARPPKTSFVNQKDQRLDVPVRFDKQFLQVLFGTKSRLCNNFYLRNFCPYGDRCTWDHSVELTSLQINTLRHKARTSACSDPYCKDPNCVLGHNCPRPSGRCNIGSCKFLPEQHDVSIDEVYEFDPATNTRKKTSRAIFRKSSTSATQKPALAAALDVYTNQENNASDERHYSTGQATYQIGSPLNGRRYSAEYGVNQENNPFNERRCSTEPAANEESTSLEDRRYSVDEATVVSEADQFLSKLGLFGGISRRASLKRNLASDYF